MFREYR